MNQKPYLVQAIAPEGWQPLAETSTWDEAEHVVDTHDQHTHENGDSAFIGWIRAASAEMAVHTRKDGRYRVIETTTNA